jgi:formamidopyrimidine-DNA glycosylase
MVKKIALLCLAAHLGLLGGLTVAAQDQSQEITDEDVLNLDDETLDSIFLDILGPSDK